MTEQEIFGKLQKVISTVLHVKPESVKMDSDLVRDFGADSLDALHILSRAEQEFGSSLRQKLDIMPTAFFQEPTVKKCVDIVSSVLTESKQQNNTVTTDNYATPTYKSTVRYNIKNTIHAIKTKRYWSLVKRDEAQRKRWLKRKRLQLLIKIKISDMLNNIKQ